MGLNNNIFYATNPARMSDALWQLMMQSGVDVPDMLIFLPSRRAVRTVEKMIAEKSGGCAILPRLVPLGEGTDDLDEDEIRPDVISDMERVIVLARLLAADACIGNLSTALPVAHDLVRMQDYLENEGVDVSNINWSGIVDEKYAKHFQNKAKILNILSEFMPLYANGRITSATARNNDIRAWVKKLHDYKLVVVCGSTASVPATSDLMFEIAKLPHGRIILSGKISGRIQDFELDTNPYNAEYKFLKRLELSPADVLPIDVGESVIDFMNYAFGNDCRHIDVNNNLSSCHLVQAPREAVEAKLVAEIASRAIRENKTVLVITPDAAGGQRISDELNVAGISADFSGGMSGTMTNAGRAILNILDSWQENNQDVFDKIYAESDFDLFNTIDKIVDDYSGSFMPSVVPDDDVSVQIWLAIKKLSDALNVADVRLGLSDARAFIADAIKSVSVRGKMDTGADVVVLGTIESRMQTADVVILTGLNDGMFPARGYENAWLPLHIAKQIGLPSPDRKVSLQALDFMNLSCGNEVYWLRSTESGGLRMPESRFISRVVARRGLINKDYANVLLDSVAKHDDVPSHSLDFVAPQPPNDWSDVYVTELDYLIHNPYAFYVKHILKLKKLDDYWALPDARTFGNLVHNVIENATDLNPDVLIQQMDMSALEILGRGNVIFHFWHKRFTEIVPLIVQELSQIQNGYSEISGVVNIAGRNVRARADMIWDGGVMDFKTGSAPNKSQLLSGNAPQLPLEALMLRSGGFKIKATENSKLPVMKFLQLKNNDVRTIEYDAGTTEMMIDAAITKVTELFNMYSAGGAPYEYFESSDSKYKQYDDFARKN